MNYKNIQMVCPYQHYYSHQAGSGVGIVYKGIPHQRGHGVGSFLGGLFRSILPLLSSGARTVGKEALNAGVGLLSDMMQSRPLEDSIKTRFKDASANLKRKADKKIDSMMTGSGYKINKKRLESSIKKKATRRAGSKNKQIFQDIFTK